MNDNLDIDNRTLVEQCMRGDRTALSLFYTRFAPIMLGIVSRYIPNRADAEDILHDGFVIAFTRLGALRDYDRVAHWLASIMKNLSLQFLQSQDVACLLHDTPEVADAPDIDDFIDIETLESLISKLPAGYQKVFRLSVLENKTHKEIADILGIAPNSSSSQLFHAKVMLRQLIRDYKRQTGLVALALLSVLGIYLVCGDGIQEPSRTPEMTALNSRNHSLSPNSVSGPNELPRQPSTPRVMPIQTDESAGANTITASPDATAMPVDTVCAALSDSISSTPATPVSKDTLFRNMPLFTQTNGDAGHTDIARSVKPAPRWEVGVTASYGLNGSKKVPFIKSMTGSGGISDPVDSPILAHHNQMPISASITASCRPQDKISIETGLVYSFLQSDFRYIEWSSSCHWHYIGIPLKLNINAYGISGLRLYATVGGEIDIPLYSRSISSQVLPMPAFSDRHFNSYISWSLTAGLGVSYRITDNLDIFIEPTLQYRFKHRHEVPNYWTDNRWCFSLPIGFRFVLPHK